MGNPDQPSDPRRLARLLAAQFLFTKLQEDKSDLELELFEPNSLLNLLEEKKYNTRLYEQIVEGVEEKKIEIDEIIQKHAPAWPLDQINPIDLVVLRIAVWEGYISKITPYKVVINEAVDLSKLMSNEKSGKFVNGVLGALFIDTPENE